MTLTVSLWCWHLNDLPKTISAESCNPTGTKLSIPFMVEVCSTQSGDLLHQKKLGCHTRNLWRYRTHCQVLSRSFLRGRKTMTIELDTLFSKTSKDGSISWRGRPYFTTFICLPIVFHRKKHMTTWKDLTTRNLNIWKGTTLTKGISITTCMVFLGS